MALRGSAGAAQHSGRDPAGKGLFRRQEIQTDCATRTLADRRNTLALGAGRRAIVGLTEEELPRSSGAASEDAPMPCRG